MLTPREFFRMYDGWVRRTSDFEEQGARWVAWLVNAHGPKRPLTPEDIMGRPFRANWEAAQKKKETETDDVQKRLAQKDRERAERNAELMRQRGL